MRGTKLNLNNYVSASINCGVISIVHMSIVFLPGLDNSSRGRIALLSNPFLRRQSVYFSPDP